MTPLQDTEPNMRRRPGRPRDEDLDAQVIEATLALIDAEEDVTVSQIVKRSGVSRAALYRRWPSLTTLVAASLDSGRTIPGEVPTVGDLREAVFTTILGNSKAGIVVNFNEARFRQRIRLVVTDRQLQKTYWTSHVTRRRAPIETAIRFGMEQKLLRDDLDVEACFDAFAGCVYYQMVVRGDPLDAPETRTRIEAAFDVIWRGMLVYKAVNR